MSGSFSSLARGAPFSRPVVAPRCAVSEPPLDKVGRRSAPRLRLSIPAKLVSVTDTIDCVLLDVSRSGARISLPDPLPIDASCILNFAGHEVFGCVTRRAKGLNAIHFDSSVADELVLATRRFAETYQADERAALMASARAWVTGGR